MNRDEAENYMKLVVPSVYDKIERKRQKVHLPLYDERFDPASQINQLEGGKQTEVIQQAITVVVQCCTKVICQLKKTVK